MLRSLLLLAIIGASLAANTNGITWSVKTSYAGTSCQGEPLVIGAFTATECILPTTGSCIIDTGDNAGTSYTVACVTTLRNTIKTLPSNYTSEIVYRNSGTNCTNIDNASYLFIYSTNKCIPTPHGQKDGWRFYDTCDANSMSSQRKCSNTCGTCQDRITRTGSCYDISNGLTGTYGCNTLNDAVLDVVASPATILKPYLIVLSGLLALIY